MKAKQLLKDIYLRCKFYKLHGSSNLNKKSIVFLMDDDYHKSHPGLVDRFKAIIGLYYLALQNERDFYLCYNTPFKLQKYLVPNEVDWQIERSDLCKNIFTTGLLNYDVKRGIPRLRNNLSEYHCYYYLGHNLIRELKPENWKKEWHDLFGQLFKPSDYLEKLLKENVPGFDYISVHFRFVNSLDKFEDGVNNQLSEAEQVELIEKCLKQLEEIQRNNALPICVFSDSSRFLKIVKDKGYYILNNAEQIGHISFSGSDETYDKTFIDFFAIANSKKVYAIRGKSLYNSVYPEYAAVVGGVEFEIHQIN